MKICFIGSGAISTAIGNILCAKSGYQVELVSIEQEVIYSINTYHINHKYFPSIQLNPKLLATRDKNTLRSADVVFFGIPSNIVVNYVVENKSFFHPDTYLVNLAKGFGQGHKTIPQCLENEVPNPIISLKGPSFAREIINETPTGLTLAAINEKYFDFFTELFNETTIFLDYSTDVIGVELASILKNIYAVIIGIVDAHYDSPNLRSLVLTKAINEMRYILSKFGGKEKTIFNYCGFGDFSLTALNDMSRNRTLGLLIGKGFFTDYISEKVILEGKIATNIFMEEIVSKKHIKTKKLMMKELYKVFNDPEYDITNFVKRILEVNP